MSEEMGMLRDGYVLGEVGMSMGKCAFPRG